MENNKSIILIDLKDESFRNDSSILRVDTSIGKTFQGCVLASLYSSYEKAISKESFEADSLVRRQLEVSFLDAYQGIQMKEGTEILGDPFEGVNAFSHLSQMAKSINLKTIFERLIERYLLCLGINRITLFVDCWNGYPSIMKGCPDILVKNTSLIIKWDEEMAEAELFNNLKRCLPISDDMYLMRIVEDRMNSFKKEADI